MKIEGLSLILIEFKYNFEVKHILITSNVKTIFLSS
jgi:hypothetical protein